MAELIKARFLGDTASVKTVTPLIWRDMAQSLADFLALQKRYETCAQLFRYAIVQEREQFCLGALEKMDCPEAALPDMVSQLQWSAFIDGRASTRFDEGTRKRLAKILGQDVGPKFADWAALYDRVVCDLPSPVPASIREEIHRFAIGYGQYLHAKRCWETVRLEKAAGQSLPVFPEPDWNTPATADLVKQLDAYVARVDQAMADLNSTTKPTSRP